MCSALILWTISDRDRPGRLVQLPSLRTDLLTSRSPDSWLADRPTDCTDSTHSALRPSLPSPMLKPRDHPLISLINTPTPHPTGHGETTRPSQPLFHYNTFLPSPITFSNLQDESCLGWLVYRTLRWAKDSLGPTRADRSPKRARFTPWTHQDLHQIIERKIIY